MKFVPLSLIILLLTHPGCKNITTKGKISGQENAVWTESIYLRGYQPSTHEVLTDIILQAYVQRLKDHHIKYAYLFAGPFDKTGHLPGYAYSATAIKTIQFIKTNAPDIVVLPWIGGVQNKTVYLGDSSWVKNALSDTKKLIEVLKVKGVHIDFEFIKAGDPYLDLQMQKEKSGDYKNYGKNVNDFHRKLRQLVPEAFISSVVVATSPDTKPWKRKTSIGELKELTRYIDQIAFLYYDTAIDNQQVFESNCLSLLRDIQTLKQSRRIQYLVAIGTFINIPELQKYRNLNVENIPNTLSTIRQQSETLSTTMPVVDGIAIFCDWETDNDEWKEIDEDWNNL